MTAAAGDLSVCQVITPSKVAGAERSTLSLCEHLQRAGVRVSVACKRGSPLIPLMRDAGLDVHGLGIHGKLNLLAPWRLAAFARVNRAKVIHTHLSTAAVHGTAAARLLGIPSVAHVRALNTATCYRAATRCIAVSRAVKDHLVAQGMRAERIDVVYSGMDPERYYLSESRESARDRLGLAGAGPIIGVVAHLTAKKGHAVLLESLSLLAARPWTAVFLGDGEEAQNLRARAAALGLEERVRFAGFHADVLPYYAAFDVLVLPSVAGEGLPRALLEAGLLGRAVVGTALSGVPEIIRDGETGFVVPISDPAALAERLTTLLDDEGLRERMGAASREWVSATFTVERMIAGTLESYRLAGVRW